MIFAGSHPSMRDVLRTIARSGTLYGASAELLGLSKGTATHARAALLDSGDLARTEDGIQLVDPLLADWLRRRFPL